MTEEAVEAIREKIGNGAAKVTVRAAVLVELLRVWDASCAADPIILTPQQRLVAGVIYGIEREHKRGAALADIGKALGLAPPTVHEHVRLMVDKGAVRHTPLKSYSIRLTQRARVQIAAGR